jgi:O-methyltransferase involved in polyketide biosynthesis
VGEKLVTAGFQQNSPAFFTWLGVVPYLTRDAIGRTLDYMSSIENSEVVFDYMEPPEAFSGQLRQLEKERTEQLEKIDERSDGRFEPAGMAAILQSHGFCAIEDVNFQEIASRFWRAVRCRWPRLWLRRRISDCPWTTARYKRLLMKSHFPMAFPNLATTVCLYRLSGMAKSRLACSTRM